MMPWAAPPPASCAPQKTTARAVVVLSSLAPYDAVGGTDDGIGPNCKADDDLKGPPPPQDAVGGTDDGLDPTPKSDDDQMGTPQPWEWHLQMTPGPRQGHGQYKSRP
ncbi:Symplekin [Manis pentadactyla]|nr:Symplekin [Manis pentadactyla]